MNEAKELLRIAGFSVLVLVEPIYALLRTSPELILAREGVPREDLLLLFTLLSIVLPLTLALCGALLRKISNSLYNTGYRLLIGILTGAFVMQLAVHHLSANAFTILAISSLPALLAIRFYRHPIMDSVLTITGAALLVTPALFFASERIQALMEEEPFTLPNATISGDNDVVFVVFDELQLAGLLDETGEVNRGLYPNFADLADHSDWFRNASSVSAGTAEAVPAILSGVMPQGKVKSPTVFNYPDNLFTRFAASHKIHAQEVLSRLCPTTLCPPIKGTVIQRAKALLGDATAIFLQVQLPSTWAGHFPDIRNTWGGFWSEGDPLFPGGWLSVAREQSQSDRRQNAERFLQAVRRSPQPTLHYLHVMLPHKPYIYHANGRRYQQYGAFYGAGPQEKVSNPWPVTRAYQRQLLQLVSVDSYLGRLVSKLRSEGIYDNALVIVAADHGVAFVPESEDRSVDSDTADDVLRIPLFIKRPGQRAGRVSDQAARTIDILPTLIASLSPPLPTGTSGETDATDSSGRKLAGAMDGRSLYAADWQDPAARPARSDQGEPLKDMLSRQLTRAFLPSGDIPRLSWLESVEELYQIGPHPELIGHNIEILAAQPTSEKKHDIHLKYRLKDLHNTTPEDRPGHTYLYGLHRTGKEPTQLALGIGPVVVAVTHTSKRRDGKYHFDFLLPPQAFAKSGTAISFYEVFGSAQEPRLRRLSVR